MHTTLNINFWLQEYTSAFFKASQNSLDLTSYSIIGEPSEEQINKQKLGAGTTLTCSSETVFISFYATPPILQIIAKRFLHIPLTEANLNTEDLHDALKELLNITTGILKRQAQSHYADELYLGLPFMIDGHAQKQKDQHKVSSMIKIGGYDILVELFLGATPQETTPVRVPDVDQSSSLSTLNWFGEILTAALVLVQACLNSEKYKVLGRVETHPKENMSSVYVPLISAGDAILVGLLVEKRHMKTIAKNFMKLEKVEDIISNEEITDASKEIINILAGIIKRQLLTKQPIVRSGIPIFMNGYLQPGENQNQHIVAIEIDKVNAYIVLMRKSSHDF